MDNGYVKTSLRDFIMDNHSLLMRDFKHQSTQRKIAHIALTNLEPPRGYYYILIYVPDSSDYTLTEGKTVQKPRPMARYDVQMEISDEALVQTMDARTGAYETMAMDFDKFIGRLCALIRGVNFVDGDNILRLKRGTGENDRRIDRNDLSGNYRNTENEEVALLYTMLRFSLEEQCVDTSRLY